MVTQRHYRRSEPSQDNDDFMVTLSGQRACMLAAALAASSLLSSAAMAQAPARKPPQDFSAIQAVQLKNEMPGKAIPYYTKNDEGMRYLIGGMVLNVSARAADSDGQYEVMTWTGGMGSGLPLHAFKASHQAFYVLQGQIDFWMDGKRYRMQPGDYANVPAGTEFAFEMGSHRTKILNWATGTDVYAASSALGTAFDGYVQPENATPDLSPAAIARSSATGTVAWKGAPAKMAAQPVTTKRAPKEAGPYVLAAGEGERYITGDQMFTYLGDAASTNGRFIALLTEGPAGGMIPAHFHALHTEIFYPLEGTVTMRGNAQTLVAHPGDTIHIPAGTIHAYQMNDHYTKFIGFLTPAVFDNFFRTLGDAYEPYVFPEKPGPLHFERVMKNIEELDIYMAE